MADHDCPGRCGAQVQQRLLACRTCWHRLPWRLKQDVIEAYRKRATDPRAHREVLATALSWYRDNPPYREGA